ncbi:MAG: glutathione peroxidase [Acidimicrobiales bacterium]|nr:MAG: glutathione peroxidase [Acidimicrobiales bacterium]
MGVFDHPVRSLEGEPVDMTKYLSDACLIVNVASRCGFTPQYRGLQELYERFAGRGLVVMGFPCNQFMEQEPGTAEEIRQFCETTFGVTFPLFEKIEVNGPNRHPIFAELSQIPDQDGNAGDIQWNFEKFLVAPGGAPVRRFRTLVEPTAPELIAEVEAVLPRS